jgi:hypothetical protein
VKPPLTFTRNFRTNLHQKIHMRLRRNFQHIPRKS